MAILISTQITGSLNVTQGITGSLFGSASNGYFAKAVISQNGTTLTQSETYNLTVSRIALGFYGFKFTSPASSSFYATAFNGVSQSAANQLLVTASIGGMFGATSSSFTMSVMNGDAGGSKSDFSSASVLVFK